MAKDANLYIRVDRQIKSEAEQLFSKFGITITDAVNMFLHKALMVGGLPFDLKLQSLVSDNEHAEAWQEFLQEIKKIDNEPLTEFEKIKFRDVEI